MMRKKGKSEMNGKILKRGWKRLLSFVLSLAMTFTLMISTSTLAYAMGITVKVVKDNTSYNLDIEPSSTVEDIKNQLAEKTGISIEQQILKYNDKELENNRTVADYNIQKGATLTLEKKASSSSNYHDTYAVLVSVPDAWRNSGGAKIWSSDLGINSDQDLEMVDQNRCLYGLKYTGTLLDNFKMYIKGGNQQAEITTSKEAAQSKYYYIANGGKWITGSEENPNSLPDLSNLNNPQYKIFALIPSEYANDIGLYSWVTGGNGSKGWPGSSMTRLQEDGNGNVLFGGNVNGANETNIIFNGKSASGSGWQTNDIYNVSPGENEAVYFKLGLDNGNYSSIERIDFKQILPSMITLSDAEYTYDGTEKTSSITVKDGDSVLSVGTDYTISGITNATEPGEYTVKITGTRTKYIGSVDVIWKINQNPDTWNYSVKDNIITASCNGECGTAGAHTAKLTLSASNATYSGKAYDGASVENNITSVTGAIAGSIKYVGRDGTTYTESTTAPTNAGKYTAKVTISGKTASADFEITKATINPSVTLDSWIYGGTAATPKVDGNTENADVTYAYKTKGAEDSTYTDATVDDIQKLAVGQYTLKATVAESTNYKGGSATCDFSITRTPIKNVSVTMTGWTYGSYDKNVNAPELGADSNPGNGDVTYTYYTDKDCTTKTTTKDGAKSEGAVSMNAGTYYVKASVAETDNYAAGEATTSFIVKTKAITATVGVESKVYDGTTDAEVTATVDTGVKGESFTISGLKGTFADKNVGSSKTVTVDSSHANATAGANTVVTNYTVSYPQTAEADITPCPAELTWSETDLIYNGTEQSVTATVKNAVKGDSFAITYEGNTETEVNDNYTAKVTAFGNDNYTLENATGISQNWSISYLEAPDAEISGEEGNNGWHVSAVTLKPEDGYQISTDKKTWSDSLGYDAQGEQEVTYYLREIKTGSITDVKTASFKIDTIAPTGEITIGTNTFKEFLNKITFGHWFKDTVSVKIAGEDSASGIDTIEYQKVGKNDKYDVNGKWVDGKSFSITGKDKYVIYARLTDKAGKQTIINSDGIVVFTDSTAVKAINYTKTTKESVDAEVALDGNTVASVKNGEAVLVEGTDYTVSADKITFSGDYLDTLSAGTHTLTVSYNPQGETEYIDGDKPVESQITVNVSRQTASLEITDALDKEYNGLPADVKYVTNSNAVVKVEYKVDGKWQTEAPTHAGSYEVRVSVPENGDYTAASDSKTFTISKTDARMATMTSGVSIYGYAVNIAATVSLVNGETYTGEIEYSYRLAGTDDAYTAGIPSKAGSYETKATVKAFGDYNGASAEGTWTIKQKEVTVSGITAKDKVYDGKATAELDHSQAAFEGILANDTLTVSATGTFADSNVASEKSVMITDLTLGGKDAGNYVLAGAGQQTITTAAITPKEVSVDITPNGGTYEGTITGATADLSGAVAGENPEIVLTYTGTANDGIVVSGTEVPTHAGTYTVTATVPDTNYSLKAEGQAAEFTVAKAAPQLSVSAVADKNYGEEAFKLETNNKGDGQKKFASDNEAVATVDENGVVTVVGAGKATLTVTLAESANYTADQKTVTITVKKIDHKLTVDKIAYEVTYGDPEFKIAAGAEDSETAVKYASDNEDVAKVSADGTVTVGNAGTAKITVSMDESGNYLAVAKEVIVTVVPKKVTVTPDKISKVYGDKDGELTYKADGMVGEDTLTDITLSRAEGENVGDYTITATQKEGANPNYEVTFNEGTFVIEPKNMETAEIILGDALKYTGKEQMQEVTKVMVDGMEVPADSYEVTGNTATEAGVHTLTITAKEESNFTGTVTWTYVIAPTKTEQIKENADGKVEIGNGTLTIAVKSERNAPKTSMVTGKAEILDMLVKSGDITADELAQIANGASVDIVLTVKDASATVSKEAKTAMTNTASKEGYTIGQYIDISLFKYMTVNGVTDEGVQLHNTANKIKIAVQIPENLINMDSKVNRTYYIIRYHDGKAEVIEGTYDEKTKIFTFETDKFSDYAIAYKDVKKTDAKTAKNNTDGAGNTTKNAVKTGDTENVFGYMIALVGAFAVILVLFASKRKKTK